MRQYHKKKHFKIRRRAVVRTIDFLVSFTLFIILLTQFYLIIINMNLNLSSISTTEENPAQLFSDKILSSPGSKDWGILSGVPQNFGLAPDQTHSGFNYYLDLAKFAHLNSELQYLSINSSYSYVTPNELLSNITGLQGSVQFRISTQPLMQVQAKVISLGTTTIIGINTTTWGNLSIPNVGISSYLVSLSTGAVSSVSANTTDYTGQTTVTATVGTDNYVEVIFAHSQDTWGISWVPIKNAPGITYIRATEISAFSLNSPDINSNSVLQFANSSLGLNINTTNAYYSSNLNNLTFAIATTANPVNITSTNVGTDTPYIQVYSMFDSTSSTYYYRVVTQPLIFDNANFISPTTANYSTSQFPVYQTPNFQISNSGTIYTYSTPVMTQRGPILFTVDYSS